jgi:hypothetical protein
MASLGRHLVPAVLFFLLVSLVFLKKPNWGDPPPPRVWTKLQVPPDAFFGAMESPAVAQAGGYLPLNGWAAAASPDVRVVKVEILLNGIVLATIEEFGYRPDVAAAFGRPDFLASGWRCVISTKRLKPGDYKLELRLIGSNGNSEIAVTKSLAIVE